MFIFFLTFILINIVMESTYKPALYSDVLNINIEQTFKAAEKMSIGYLSRSGYCFSPDEKAGDIYEIIKVNPVIAEFTVVQNDIPIGFMTRTGLSEILGGQYGFSLFSNIPIREIMKIDFLSVDYSMQIDQVSRLAMHRPFDLLYNPVVIKQEGKYFGIVTVKDLLDTSTKMALAERNEIALMRDNLKIGLFFMDRDFIIQDQYSRYLEELFSQKNLDGKNFIDLLSSSVAHNELDAVKDYFNMLIERSFDQDTLDDINPLTELYYSGGDTFNKKVFQCGFAVIERNQGEVFVLVSVYDITAKVELLQRLTEEENRRNDEMKTVFELLQVEPELLHDFLEDTEYEFERINKTQKSDTISTHEALVEIYQSVHAIKSNAFILGQMTFGGKVHNLESKIKKLREQKREVPFNDMLDLAMEIEKLLQEKEAIKTTIKRVGSNKFASIEQNQVQYVLIESLLKTAAKTSCDMGKKVKFIVDKVDSDAIEKGLRRIIKEVLIQLTRNSVVHGIESPEGRLANGKDETGKVRLSIVMEDGKIHVRLADDGGGLDYDKIAKKALRLNLIKPEDAKNKNALLKAVFLPGFSTAETEGIHAGRGIGLNMVQDRVRDGKGSIKVQSEHGKGTVFHIYFPVN